MKHSRRFLCLLLAAAIAVGLTADVKTPSFAFSAEEEHALMEAAQAMRRSGLVQFNFKDMDLVLFIRFMSELFSTNFVITSNLKQKVTVIMSHPVTLQEAWKIMLVVLDDNDLYLEDIEDIGEHYILRRSTSRPPRTSAIKNNQRNNSRPAAKSVPSTLSDDVMHGTLPASLLKQFIDNPFNELKLIRARPNDKTMGIEVQWMQNDSLFKRLGVQRGDSIVSVNGIRFGNMNSIDEIIHTILKGQSFDFEVVRDGRNIKLLNAVTIAPEIQINSKDISGDVTENIIQASLLERMTNDPFEELKRIRMRPNDKASGLEVQWIQNNSILKRLGVQRGDVIKSVNGISILNFEDITKAIDSVINSKRFDIDIIRDGRNISLRYAVK